MAVKPDGRLGPDTWIDAALDVLAARGVDAIRVEVLARALNVTKGSFYWHFKDRDALLVAVLEHWRDRATRNIIVRLSHEPSARERFRSLMRLPFSRPSSERGADVELAIRLWGRTDERAASVLRDVDSERIAFLRQLLVECGADEEEADARAVLAYSYMRVARTLVNAAAQETMTACEALLMGGALRT